MGMPSAKTVLDKTAEEPAKPLADPAAPERVCTEKQRLRWEAMMMDWGRDCESKLGAARGLIKSREKIIHP